jgi:hypothetical protein
MARTLNLNQNANVTLDQYGNGTVQAGPQIPGVTWTVTLAACTTASVVNTPVFNLYLGDPIPQNNLGGTYSGNNDEYTPLSAVLPNGQYMTGQWTGGDPGALATMTLTGTQQVP